MSRWLLFHLHGAGMHVQATESQQVGDAIDYRIVRRAGGSPGNMLPQEKIAEYQHLEGVVPKLPELIQQNPAFSQDA
jgi:hypothetical protein